MVTRLPLNLMKWIEDHEAVLKPPVGNAQVWEDGEFMVTIVGGPNVRTDYHDDPGDEFFYQLKGDINLRVIENGKPKDMPSEKEKSFSYQRTLVIHRNDLRILLGW